MPDTKTEALTIARRTLDTIVDEMTIVDTKGQEWARDVVRKIKTEIVNVHDELDKAIGEAHNLHRTLTGQRKKFLDPLDKLKVAVERKMGAYNQRLEDEAAKERHRLAGIARKEAEDARLAEAEQLEAAGEKEAAEVVIQAPIVVSAPPPPPPPKVEGVTQTRTREARVVCEGLVPREHCSSDSKKLKAYARSMGEQAVAPGVEFWWKDTTSVRKAAV